MSMRWSKILTEPKNALTKQYSKLFEMEASRSISARMACAPLPKAMERKTGARDCVPSWKVCCWIPCTTSRQQT